MDIAVLVFREGVECILVLAAITASLVGASRFYRRLGVALAMRRPQAWALALDENGDIICRAACPTRVC